ncbi:MAG: YlxR family protein [Oscillospiraceae bacterium]|nr:YlxR family protein [Oscillospiraceae bacterium]
MKTRKIPIRMCAGCGERKEKKALIRVVRGPEGDISLDGTGKKSGRGAYICRDPQCLKKARKARRLERSFACQIPDEVYSRLEGELEADGT